MDAVIEKIPNAPERHRRMARVIVLKGRAAKAPESDQIEDPFLLLIEQGMVVLPPLPPEDLLNISESNAIHAACIQAKTIDTVGHGWRYESLGEANQADEGKVKTEVDAWLEEITPDFTFAEMLEQARWELEAVGWSAWEVDRGGIPDGEILGIFPVPVHTLRAGRRADKKKGLYAQIVGGETRYFVQFGSGLSVSRTTGQDLQKQDLRKWLLKAKAWGSEEAKKDENAPAHELIVFRPYHYASPYYGVPRWIAAQASIAELSAIREFNISYFQSSGLMDTILQCAAEDIANAGSIQDDLEAQIEEARGQGHFILAIATTADAKITPIKLGQETSSKEGHFKERREDLVKEVLMAHQVPPYRVGWAEIGSLGGSAAKEMLRAYRYGAIEPAQRVIEDRLQKTLFSKAGRDLQAMGFRWRLENIDWDEEELNLSVAVEGVRTGIFSPNEARERLGQSRKDEPSLDEHYMNGMPMGPPPASPSAGIPGVPTAASLDGPEDSLFKTRRERFAKIDARRGGHLSPTAGALKALIERERDEVLSALKRAASPKRALMAAEGAIGSQAGAWKTWLRETYERVADDMAVEALEDMVGQGLTKEKKPGKKPTPAKPGQSKLPQAVVRFLGGEEKATRVRDIWREKVTDWLRSEAGEKITGQIHETTRQEIRDLLTEGVKAGEGIDDLAKRIDGLYGDEIIPHRAEVIARTEVISASNLGSVEAAKAAASVTGMTLVKRWLATPDDRTRDSHRAMDGVEVEMDEPFIVDGERLMFPGDSSLGASGKAVIQCRCTVTYSRKRE